MDPVNILLVDDQPAKLLSYEVILQGLGENLIKARSGREALEHLLRMEIAVILVDVCMPDQDGFELVAMIREHPRYQKTAIIFVSAVMMAEPDRLRGYEAGAVDYVSVPVVPELLRAKVKVFAELYRKTRQLERFNAQLEQRVADRTAELQASSSQLAALNEQLEYRIEERTREREEALAQLFEAQKLDTIGQLTGGVAHDFNNLLMAALSSLELLSKRLSDDERSRRLLNNAIQAAERGAALTQRLLAFSRRQELRPQAVDIIRVVTGMEDLLQRAMGPGIRFRSELPDDLAWVLVDANQLELALLNLVINARDAMPEGGTVTILAVPETVFQEAAKLKLELGNYIRIRVADTGCGMDEETLAKATEPFFTTKGTGKGTGLGLSMVQGLAAQSGGTLVLSSKLGEGTTIDLWLPVAGEIPAHSIVSENEAPVAEGRQVSRTILVVDDDALVSMGTAAMLEDLGHRVTEVSSGADALAALARNQSFDLVITDHAMPGMTGCELAAQIKNLYPSMPIILASGYVELPGGFELPDIPRLSKPFSQDQLVAALSRSFAPDGSPKNSNRQSHE
ncbi:response regulator [Pararhizobium sp. BT-229]|uniref:response regulator n=1 Tax=Pararhizobium sp. BT-229 TaxID=2986923 RepID=UPI0021F6EA5B|nr:response regulator [Pararhizobium sp. BT-229]MCV9967448.1 response regulator [Pararhizobium sp. BT-229]